MRLNLKNNYFVILFTVIGILIFTQCGKPETDDSRLGLEVDSTKFGKYISDNSLQIEYYAPIDWKHMQSEISEKNESLINKRKAKERYIYSPSHIFFNDSTRSILNVGEVNDSSNNGKPDSLIINYVNMLTAKFEGDDFYVEDLEPNDVKLKQFMIKKPQIVSYKIIFENKKGKLIQFDYTVPNQFFEAERIAISSSISTIRYLKEN
ncbi:hypothetical protein ACFLQT_00030 [Bacteroidota bacterium]